MTVPSFLTYLPYLASSYRLLLTGLWPVCSAFLFLQHSGRLTALPVTCPPSYLFQVCSGIILPLRLSLPTLHKEQGH